MEKIKSLLTGSSLSTRLFSLWAIGILLNLIAWYAGYYLFPEGVLRGILPGGSFVPDQEGFLSTIMPILLYNILIGSGLIFCANLFRIQWFPLGYVPVLVHWMMFGLFLGTNSFDLSAGGKIAPSLPGLIQSAGFIEISAFTFIAVASINLYLYRQKSIWSLKTEKMRLWSQVRIIPCEYIAILSAYIMIFLAAFKETISIMLKSL